MVVWSDFTTHFTPKSLPGVSGAINCSKPETSPHLTPSWRWRLFHCGILQNVLSETTLGLTLRYPPLSSSIDVIKFACFEGRYLCILYIYLDELLYGLFVKQTLACSNSLACVNVVGMGPLTGQSECVLVLHRVHFHIKWQWKGDAKTNHLYLQSCHYRKTR